MKTVSSTNCGYLSWFLKGSGGKPGYTRLFNKWLFIHASVAMILVGIIQLPLAVAAHLIIFILGVSGCITFVYTKRARLLLQSREIIELAKYHSGGLIEYIYVYQTSILLLLITSSLWELANLRVFERFVDYPSLYLSVKFVLFLFFSITLRECWHVVLGVRWMSLIQKELKSRIS